MSASIVSGRTVVKPRAVWASKHHGTNGAWQLADEISDQHDNHWNASAHEHEQRTLFVVLPQTAPAKVELHLRMICATKWGQHVPGCIRATVVPEPAMESAIQAVKRIHAGTVNVNEIPGYRLELSPFGGIKDSGLGIKEGVIEAIKFMTTVKTFSLPW